MAVTRGSTSTSSSAHTRDNGNEHHGRRSLVYLLNCIRQWQRATYSNAIAKAMIIFCVSQYAVWKLYRQPDPTAIKWANEIWNPKYHNQLSACQTTLFQPFRVGCPTTCLRATSKNETMYRMNAAWYFGKTNNLTLLEPNVLPTAYDMGINYQAPYSFMQAFVGASRELQSIIVQGRKFPPSLTFLPQERAHMALAYFCCLRKNETDWIREIVAEWIAEQHPFQFDVSFAGLQCWQERYNSITNILVVDERTQRLVMDMVHSLYDKIAHQYHIPMEISREQQMPIHMTLAGLQYGSGESMAPQHNISPILSDVFDAIRSIDQKYAGKWIGPDRLKMQVTHDPKYSSKGMVHVSIKDATA
jgi:hypothetical protein